LVSVSAISCARRINCCTAPDIQLPMLYRVELSRRRWSGTVDTVRSPLLISAA
jgi:hypothetical protein